MSRENTLEFMLDFGEDGRKLVPVVTQDINTKEVLLLAYVNKQAFDTTLETGYAMYWSRSRDKLWIKGAEESGNRLAMREIRVNCEQDSLLYLVEKVKGGACHAIDENGEKYSSCYYRRLTNDGEGLEKVK
jgi:phosphoribosyl-AMP cyclohydrolase